MRDIQTLEWVDDLPMSRSSKANIEYAPLREDLASRPGYWARLADFDDIKGARSLTMRLRTEGFKFSWRQTGESQWSVFGRYEGANGEAAS